MYIRRIVSSLAVASLVLVMCTSQLTVKSDAQTRSGAQNKQVTKENETLQNEENETDIFSFSYNEKELTEVLEKASEPQEEEQELPESYVITDFPVIDQMPELPTGCEITAMTMVLNYYGYSVDKVTMATKYLSVKESEELHQGEDGKLYGADMNQYFIGDPTTEAGIACGTEAILKAANTYLKDEKSKFHAEDKNGATPEELYRLVSQNVPVVVWCTIGMQDRIAEDGWYTDDGEYVDWAYTDHGAVLIGYSRDTVTIADPISGKVEYDRAQFESVFASRNNKCVILTE